MRTKYGYKASVTEARGVKQVMFERDEGHSVRATFLLTRDDLEEAARMLSEACFRIGDAKPLCCLDGDVLFEKREG